jgi:type II secretory pathway component GspD/PulD (secretin)
MTRLFRLLLLLRLAPRLAMVACAQEPATTDLMFANLDLHDALAVYARLSGNRVVTDERFAGNISVWATKIPKAKAVDLFEQAMFAQGYAIFEPKPGVVRVMSLGQLVTKETLPVVSKVENLPAGERVVTYVCKLRAREPKEFVEVLQRQIHAGNLGIPSFQADEKEGAVRITDRTSSLRKILRLIEELDRKK